jgi:hypothetical protein
MYQRILKVSNLKIIGVHSMLKANKQKNRKKMIVLGVIFFCNISYGIYGLDNSDGIYSISCKTKNKGKKLLEAYPIGGDVARLREKSGNQDQKWRIQIKEGAYYSISCETKNKGKKFLEAYPIGGDVARLRAESDNQDQKWRIQIKEGAYYSISCETKNKSEKFLEAFPRDGAVARLREKSGNQDQKWRIKLIQNLVLDNPPPLPPRDPPEVQRNSEEPLDSSLHDMSTDKDNVGDSSRKNLLSDIKNFNKLLRPIDIGNPSRSASDRLLDQLKLHIDYKIRPAMESQEEEEQDWSE